MTSSHCLRHLVQHCRTCDGGVVDQDVDSANVSVSGGDHRIDLVATRHIASHADRLGTAGAQCVCERVGPFQGEIDGAYPGTALGKCGGHRRADPLCGTRDDRGPAIQLHFHRSRLSFPKIPHGFRNRASTATRSVPGAGQPKVHRTVRYGPSAGIDPRQRTRGVNGPTGGEGASGIVARAAPYAHSAAAFVTVLAPPTHAVRPRPAATTSPIRRRPPLAVFRCRPNSNADSGAAAPGSRSPGASSSCG